MCLLQEDNLPLLQKILFLPCPAEKGSGFIRRLGDKKQRITHSASTKKHKIKTGVGHDVLFYS